MLNSPRVMLVGGFAAGSLERSYLRAFGERGCEVQDFDMQNAIQRNVRLGRFGEEWNRFLPVEPWINKANREIVLAASVFKPDILVVTGQARVRAGALAQMRAIQPRLRTVLIWPDTMVFLSGPTIQCLPLYDLVATYSHASVESFQRLGSAAVAWIPLAADPTMHTERTGRLPDPQADVGFIGQWRPERESALTRLLADAPELSIRIWGPDWGRRCKGKSALISAWQGRSLFDQEFADAVAVCKINLNIIDPTNFPAANMRFFELMVAGGLELTTMCPEMEKEFQHNHSVFYYETEDQLAPLVRRLLADPEARKRVADTGRAQVLAAHTYSHRAGAILNYFRAESS